MLRSQSLGSGCEMQSPTDFRQRSTLAAVDEITSSTLGIDVLVIGNLTCKSVYRLPMTNVQ